MHVEVIAGKVYVSILIKHSCLLLEKSFNEFIRIK